MTDLVKNETLTAVTSNGLMPVSFLREPVVRKAVGGIGKTTLWRWVREGRFPKPVRLGANCVAWRSDEVNHWMDSRPAFDVEEA